MKEQVFEELIVVKRSGQRVSFNGSKIAIAIKKAFDDVLKNYNLKEANKVYEDTIDYIVDNYKSRKTINVEDIQDIIEDILKKDKYEDVYNSFKEYRLRRAESRKAFSLKQQHKFVKAIEKLEINDSEIKKPSDSLLLYGKTISREYTKSYIIDNKYTRAHEEGKIFINNFDYFNLGYLNDTNIKLDKIPLNKNYFYNLTNMLITLENEIKGNVGIIDFDIILNKYILLEYKNIYKKTLYKYLNIMGFLPLINMKKIEDIIDKQENIDFKIEIFSEILLNDQITNIFKTVTNDSISDITYLLNNNIKYFLLELNKSNNKYSISVSKNNNLIKDIIINTINKLDYLDNVNLVYKLNNKNEIDELFNLLNKNISLNLSNIDYMGNGVKISENSNGDKTSIGRSVIASTSINLTRLGLKYNKLSNEFYKELDELIEFVKNELLFVFETIGDKYKNNYQILFNGNILDDEKLEGNQKVRKVIKNGTLNINLIGLNECSILIDKDNNLEIIYQIIKYLNNKINKIINETKLNFTLSSINDKSISKELINVDKTIYGLIDDITKKDIYDNISCINIIDDKTIEYIGKYQKLLTGGNVLELVLSKNINIKKLDEIINLLYKYNIEFVKIRSKV